MSSNLIRILFAWILFPLSSFPQFPAKVEPPSWWIGMHEPVVQLMVHCGNIYGSEPRINYPGVRIREIHHTVNPNYLFIDLEIETQARPGKVPIVFEYQREIVAEASFELLERRAGSQERRGFGPGDVIYLAMPDRFANGDPSNDQVDGLLEAADRLNPNGRHGGDLEGIRNQLGYLQSLGVTALWLNPVLESNLPAFSYHGYSITDFYSVDARFGGNSAYLSLVRSCHERGLKVVMDMIFNHCGDGHWWMKDLPDSNWIHGFPEFTRTNFRAETAMDPYVSESDRKRMLTGWFDVMMPDLDQRNPYLANYLIQNSIWWIEKADLDGIRMDTYPYSYPEFMRKWMRRVRDEYPGFSVVGETWLQKEAHTAFFQENPEGRFGEDSHLPYVTDFPLQYAMKEAFNEPDSWTTGLARLYYILTQDYLYHNALHTVTFVDNHDLSRFFSTIGEDLAKWKMAMAFLLTTRGVPMIYYGTEILATGMERQGHGFIRQDFPGGWDGDPRNAFIAEGRTVREQEAFAYLSRLLAWRKGNTAVAGGQMKHFIPVDGIYVYFRFDPHDCVMVVLNNNDKASKIIDPGKYRECLGEKASGLEVISGRSINLDGPFTIPAKSSMIIDIN